MSTIFGDPQAVYDRVCWHLCTQHQQARNEIGGRLVPVWVDRTGLRSPAGCVLPSPIFVWGNPQWLLIAQMYNFNLITVPLIADLQLIHDKVPVPRWPEYLHLAGDKHKLNKTVLTDLLTPTKRVS